MATLSIAKDGATIVEDLPRERMDVVSRTFDPGRNPKASDTVAYFIGPFEEPGQTAIIEPAKGTNPYELFGEIAGMTD